MNDEQGLLPETLESTAEPDTAPAAKPDDGLTPRERRQRRQALERLRRRERLLWYTVSAAGILALGAFLYFFWPIMAGRLDAVKQIDQAQALVNGTKPTVNSIDKLVTAQLSAAAAPGVPDTAPQILVARRDLKQALALVDGAMPRLTEDEQKHAQDVRNAAQARLDMINRAPAILVASTKAVKAKAFMDQADKVSQEASAGESVAAANYRAAKASKVESTSVSLQRVKGQFSDAKGLYAAAAGAFPEAGFERYSANVGARLLSVKQLASAASKWLGGNSAGAAGDYSAYQTTLAKAVSAAAKLPSAPAAPGQAFRKAAAPAVAAYAKSKKLAAEADKALATP